MTRQTQAATALILLLIGVLAAPAAVRGQQFPTSDLLLPYFEADLTGFKLTTLIEVTNAEDVVVPVKLTVYTNWGLPVLEINQDYDPRETKAYNLRDWLMLGLLPDGESLTPEEVLDLQAKLSGRPSPVDQLYYSTEIEPELAVGYVAIRSQGIPRRDALWGSVFVVNPNGNSAQGETLIDIDPASVCKDICQRHNLFWVEGGDFDGGTEVIIWTGRRGVPSPDPIDDLELARAEIQPYDQEGNALAFREDSLMAVETMRVADLGLSLGAGWIDLITESAIGSSLRDSFVAVRHTAASRYSVALRAWCRELPPAGGDDPRIRIEKLTNGEDADTPPGPTIPVGDPVFWEYIVSNVGPVDLTDVQVSDDRGVAVSCPEDSLDVGEAMICTASGIATEGLYRNVGTATGRGPNGSSTIDDDPSHYTGILPGESRIDIEKATNGVDADTQPGVLLDPGDPILWTYVVTNTGDLALSNVTVIDDQGVAVSCPQSSLAPGAQMTCTAVGIAQSNTNYTNVGTATGLDPEGNTRTDSDPSNYTSVGDPGIPRIDIEKLTNGHDADNPPGPTIPVGTPVTWTYIVTNIGDQPLDNISVTDDQGVAVSCPQSSLAVGTQMFCTGQGVAQVGDYWNIGTAIGFGTGGDSTTDSDPSHYFGGDPKIDLEKATNGHDADSPTGPMIPVGDPVTWTYVVTNTGNVELTGVSVSDNQGVAVSCPASSLGVGQSMTCTGHGTAQPGQYANLGTVTGTGAGIAVSDDDPSHYFGEEPCGTCEGKVTRLTVQYLGASTAQVVVIAKRGPQDDQVFSGTVAPGGVFELVGPPHPNGGFNGTLGTEVDYFVDGAFNTQMHTSCSQPIGPGTVSGDFLVLAGASSVGGPLCPS